MKCEIISIGSELLGGVTSPSSTLVAGALASIGLVVKRTVTVGDYFEDIQDVLKESISRSDIVITIGGMGSSPKDITVQTVARTLAISLRFSRKAMENIAKYFASQGREVPKHCDKQANIIEGATVLENLKGSSPGQFVEIEKNKIVILLPGPKEEVKYILYRNLLKILKDRFEAGIRKSVVLHILGMCEADVAEKLKEILDTESHLEEGEVEFYFESTAGGADFTINCTGNNEMLVDELLHKTKTEVYNLLKDDIYGEDNNTLEEIIGRLLTKKRKTLSIAESVTGGLLASKITDAAGSSIYFRESVVTYSTEAKIKHLNVPGEVIKKYGAVSKETAIEMAQNIRKISATDYAISLTGYASPGSVGKKGYISLSCEEETMVEKVVFSGSRKEVKEKFAVKALEMLWRSIKLK